MLKPMTYLQSTSFWNIGIIERFTDHLSALEFHHRYNEIMLNYILIGLNDLKEVYNSNTVSFSVS